MLMQTGMAPVADTETVGEMAPKEAAAGEPLGPRSWPSQYFAPMRDAHVAARAAIKAVRPATKVGWSLALVDMQAAPGGEERLARMLPARSSTGSTCHATTTGSAYRPTPVRSSDPTASCRRPRAYR